MSKRCIRILSVLLTLLMAASAVGFAPQVTRFAVLSDWERVGSDWIYTGSDGMRMIGWQKLGGCWYYFNNNGIMQTGWQKIDGKWYYFNPSGAMQTGWQKLGGNWYYFNPSGAMQTGWQKIGGKWYYFNASGVMKTGWQHLGGNWYYFNSSGTMQTAWQKIGGKWYYFNTSGVMQTEWQKIGLQRYYFNQDGSWQEDVTALKSITVSGVTFDLNNWLWNTVIDGSKPKYTAGDTVIWDNSRCLLLDSEQEISPFDMEYRIVGQNYSLYDHCETYEGSDWMCGSEYFVGGEQNTIAYVTAGWDTEMAYPNRVEMYLQNATGSFTVEAYYRNHFVASCDVEVAHGYDDLLHDIDLVHEMEQNANWDTAPSDLEKLKCLASYIHATYPYASVMCNSGAYFMMLAARYDLGINGCFYERSVANGGGNDSITRYTGGSSYVGGHVYLVTIIDGVRYEWNVQGY